MKALLFGVVAFSILAGGCKGDQGAASEASVAPAATTAAAEPPKIEENLGWKPAEGQIEPPPGVIVERPSGKTEMLGALGERADEVVVRFKPQVGRAEMQSFHELHGTRVVYRTADARRIRLREGTTVMQAMAAMRKDDRVQSVSPSPAAR
jgi:hypothetical protein